MPRFSLDFPGKLLYRAEPFTSAQVSPAQLDAAVDTNFAHPVASADAATEVLTPYP